MTSTHRRAVQSSRRHFWRTKLSSENDRFVNEVDKEMLIGIISDTHGLLRQEVKDELKKVDMIIHAGDIDRESLLDELKKISSSLTVVRGNADK